MKISPEGLPTTHEPEESFLSIKDGFDKLIMNELTEEQVKSLGKNVKGLLVGLAKEISGALEKIKEASKQDIEDIEKTYGKIVEKVAELEIIFDLEFDENVSEGRRGVLLGFLDHTNNLGSLVEVKQKYLQLKTNYLEMLYTRDSVDYTGLPEGYEVQDYETRNAGKELREVADEVAKEYVTKYFEDNVKVRINADRFNNNSQEELIYTLDQLDTKGGFFKKTIFEYLQEKSPEAWHDFVYKLACFQEENSGRFVIQDLYTNKETEKHFPGLKYVRDLILQSEKIDKRIFSYLSRTQSPLLKNPEIFDKITGFEPEDAPLFREFCKEQGKDPYEYCISEIQKEDYWPMVRAITCLHGDSSDESMETRMKLLDCGHLDSYSAADGFKLLLKGLEGIYNKKSIEVRRCLLETYDQKYKGMSYPFALEIMRSLKGCFSSESLELIREIFSKYCYEKKEGYDSPYSSLESLCVTLQGCKDKETIAFLYEYIIKVNKEIQPRLWLIFFEGSHSEELYKFINSLDKDKYHREIAKSLNGDSSKTSMELRRDLMKKSTVNYHQYILESLRGVDTDESFDLRMEIVKEMGWTENVMLSLIGVSNPRSMKMRKEYLESTGEGTDTARSLEGIHTDESIDLLEKCFNRVKKNDLWWFEKDAILCSLIGCSDSRAMNLRLKILGTAKWESHVREILDSLKGISTDNSMDVRRKCLTIIKNKFKSSGYNELASSLSGVYTHASFELRSEFAGHKMELRDVFN